MKVNQNKIRVVVPELETQFHNAKPKEFYTAEGHNICCKRTLQSELPDVNECVVVDVEDYIVKWVKGTPLSNVESELVTLTWGDLRHLARAIATSTDILKWREIDNEKAIT